jgi:hypothetical protein
MKNVISLKLFQGVQIINILGIIGQALEYQSILYP